MAAAGDTAAAALAELNLTTAAANNTQPDAKYPGTAVARLREVHRRVQSLSSKELSVDWITVRRRLLWAGGLKDLPDAVPGQGYTGHSFNDFNHCDLTTMLLDVAHNEHKGDIPGIARGNALGSGIIAASLPMGEPSSGSWSTCIMGCHKNPPEDVAHVQFKSRIAFKLVWCPPDFATFVLVDDAGRLLNYGTPQADSSGLPSLRERHANYHVVGTGKYSTVARHWAASDKENAKGGQRRHNTAM